MTVQHEQQAVKRSSAPASMSLQHTLAESCLQSNTSAAIHTLQNPAGSSPLELVNDESKAQSSRLYAASDPSVMQVSLAGEQVASARLTVAAGLPDADASYVDGPNAVNGSVSVTNAFTLHLKVGLKSDHSSGTCWVLPPAWQMKAASHLTLDSSSSFTCHANGADAR